MLKDIPKAIWFQENNPATYVCSPQTQLLMTISHVLPISPKSQNHSPPKSDESQISNPSGFTLRERGNGEVQDLSQTWDDGLQSVSTRFVLFQGELRFSADIFFSALMCSPRIVRNSIGQNTK